MLNIQQCTEFYLDNDYDEIYARSKVGQDIILSAIGESKYNRNITIKGGVVLFNITGDKRRATEDIDIDLIRYSLDDASIIKMFESLNRNSLNITFKIVDKITKLRQQDYNGKRIFLLLEDNFGNNIKIKMDIGVQSNLSVFQEEFVFNFEVLDKKIALLINTKEQIFIEKLSSLIKHGIASTRFKDIFDFYYFITSDCIDKDDLLELLDVYIFQKENYEISNIHELYLELEDIFDNKGFQNRLSTTKYNWLNIDSNIALKIILEFVNSLEKVGV